MKCECGCGEDAPLSDRTDRGRGRIKGQPLRFVHGHNRRLPRNKPSAKACSRCRFVKPAREFYLDRTRASGLSSECRACRKEGAQAWYQENVQDPAAPDRERHREARFKARTRWRTRQHGVVYEDFSPDAIYKRDGGKCWICGKRVNRADASLDHVTFLARGGHHTETNVRLAHLSCNVRRNHQETG